MWNAPTILHLLHRHLQRDLAGKVTPSQHLMFAAIHRTRRMAYIARLRQVLADLALECFVVGISSVNPGLSLKLEGVRYVRVRTER